MVDIKTINNQASPGAKATTPVRPAGKDSLRADGAASPNPLPAAAAAGQVTVTVTETVAMLRQIEDQISNVPLIDNEKVVALREAIRNGTFKIDARRTAEKLLAFA